MSVWFKYAGDKDITPGHPGGTSLFKPPVSGSCPPAGYSGTTLTGIEFPVAQGGSYFLNPVNLVDIVLTQICDVPVNNDGSCGTYNDWASVANIAYKAYGTQFYVNDVNQPTAVSTAEVPSGSGNFIPNGFVDIGYNHDGAGGYYSEEINFNYFNNGSTTGVSQNEEVQVPTGGDAYGTGRYQNYIWDGSGGFSLDSTFYGTYQPANQLIWQYATGTGGTSVEIPYGSGNWNNDSLTGDRYEWNGSGGYNYFSSWYYASGTYITNDGVDNYYWDGSGGYYTQPM